MTGLTTEQIKELPKLRAEGKNNQEIALELGCSIFTVRRWFRALKAKGYDIGKPLAGRKGKLEENTHDNQNTETNI